VSLLRRNGSRFVAEVVAIFLAAAISGPLLDLGTWTIIAVIVVVWTAIAIFEYGRAHPRAVRERRRRPRFGEPDAEPVETVEDLEPAFERVRVLVPSRTAAAGTRAAEDAEPERDGTTPGAVEAPQPQPEVEPERTPLLPVAEPAVAAAVAVAVAQADGDGREPEDVAAAPAAAEPEQTAEAPPPAAEPLPVTAAPWSWNVWNLERVVRERAAANDELNYLLLYLREYANPAGMLPPDFDALVRESFGDLLAAPS
jgi:hypothetical protein